MSDPNHKRRSHLNCSMGGGFAVYALAHHHPTWLDTLLTWSIPAFVIFILALSIGFYIYRQSR